MAAYCSSDEEGAEDYKNQLMFLPTTSEIEDSELDVAPLIVSSSKFRTIDIYLDNTTDG